MGKFIGYIGVSSQEETSPGIWETISDRIKCKGDSGVDYIKLKSGKSINDTLDISNIFSVVLNPKILRNLQYLQYIEYLGVKWKITSFDVIKPRIIIRVGGVYNGDQTGTTPYSD